MVLRDEGIGWLSRGCRTWRADQQYRVTLSEPHILTFTFTNNHLGWRLLVVGCIFTCEYEILDASLSASRGTPVGTPARCGWHCFYR